MVMIYSATPLSKAEYTPVATNYYAPREEWAGMTKSERHLDMCACVARRRKSLMFTGQSACCVYNIPRLDIIELRPNCISDKIKGSDIIRWHHGPLDHNAKVINGFLVASPIRTIFDLAKYDSPESLLVSINHCLNKGLFGRDEFSASLISRKGMHNKALLKRLLRFANENCQSPLETIGWLALYKAGFVLPKQQVDIYDKHELAGCVDMYWELRKRRIVLELDGKVKYNVDHDLYAEKLREDHLRRLGYEVFRSGWNDITSGKFIQMVKDIGIPVRRNFVGTFPE